MTVIFRDQAFCDSDCMNVECPRHFGDDDMREAREWWGKREGEPPVGFSPLRLLCSSYVPPEKG